MANSDLSREKLDELHAKQTEAVLKAPPLTLK